MVLENIFSRLIEILMFLLLVKESAYEYTLQVILFVRKLTYVQGSKTQISLTSRSTT